MFHIAQLTGTLRPFVAGEIRSKRQVVPIIAPSQVEGATESYVTVAESTTPHSSVMARYQAHEEPTDRRELLFAHQIMTTRVFSIAPETPIREVTKLFAERRYRHIPVTSPDTRVLGLISDRELWRYRAEHPSREAQIDKLPISNIMVSDVLVATADTLIRELARTMFEERIGSMPIVAEQNTLVGIVTRSDIVRALITYGPMRIWA